MCDERHELVLIEDAAQAHGAANQNMDGRLKDSTRCWFDGRPWVLLLLSHRKNMAVGGEGGHARHNQRSVRGENLCVSSNHGRSVQNLAGDGTWQQLADVRGRRRHWLGTTEPPRYVGGTKTPDRFTVLKRPPKSSIFEGSKDPLRGRTRVAPVLRLH